MAGSQQIPFSRALTKTSSCFVVAVGFLPATPGLSGGRGRAAAERVEADVGSAARPSLDTLRELLAQALHCAQLPHKDCTVLQSIHEGIAEVKRGWGEASHSGAPPSRQNEERRQQRRSRSMRRPR